MRFLGGVREGGAGGCHTPAFLTAEASPFLMHCSCSSRVSFFESLTMSMFIAFRSLAIWGEEKDWKV